MNLIQSIKENKLTSEYIDQYISEGGCINERDRKGRTPLMWAVLMNRPNYLNLLIQFGANLDLQDNLCRTAIFIASRIKRLNCFEILIKNGANVQVPYNYKYDLENFNLIEHIIYFNKKQMFDLIIQHGVDFNSEYRAIALASFLGHTHFIINICENTNINDEMKKLALVYCFGRTVRHHIIKYLLDIGVEISIDDILNHISYDKDYIEYHGFDVSIEYLKRYKLNRRMKKKLQLI